MYRDDAIDSPMIADSSATYVWGPNGIVSELRNGVVNYYHGDALGTTRAMTTQAGAQVAALETDAFGNRWTGGATSRFGYAGAWGYQTDADSGLMLLGHRYYDASVGRFISRDPAMAGYNWYAYADNDPVNNADPEGLEIFIIGGTKGDQAKVRDALKLIGTTQRGKELIDMVDGVNDTDLRIIIKPNTHNSYGYKRSDGSGTIYLEPDPSSTGRMEFFDSKGKPYWDYMPLWRWIGHEMGHAVAGAPGGNVIDENRNIRDNEAPIAKGLGAPRRGSWDRVRF